MLERGWLGRFDRKVGTDPTDWDGLTDGWFPSTVDSQGNRYMSGWAGTTGYGDVFLGKIGLNGEQLLSLVRGPYDQTTPVVITFMDNFTVDRNEDIVFTARLREGSLNYLLVVKMDSNLNVIWCRRMDTNTQATSIAFDSANNIFIGRRFNTNPYNGIITKLSGDNGAHVASRQMAVYFMDSWVSVDADDNVWVADWLDSNIIKFDSDLTHLGSWQLMYGAGGSSARISGFHATADAVYVCDYDMVAKLSADMQTVIWKTTTTIPNDEFDDPGDDPPGTWIDAWFDTGPMTVDADENVYHVMSLNWSGDNSVGNNSGIWVIKYNSDGAVVWSRFLNLVWPEEDELDDYGEWVVDDYHNVWNDRSDQGFVIRPDSVNINFTSYCSIDGDDIWEPMGDGQGYVLTLKPSGADVGDAFVSIDLQGDWPQHDPGFGPGNLYRLRDNGRELIPRPAWYLSRPALIAVPTTSVTVSSLTEGNSTYALSLSPAGYEFTWSVDWFDAYVPPPPPVMYEPNMRTSFRSV